MNTPYTYLLGWPKFDRWYYGVRYAKGCHPDDLLNPYMTSSRYVSEFIEENGMPEVVEIRKTFASSDAARNWETKVLRKMKVVVFERWLNKTDNIAIANEVGGSLSDSPEQKKIRYQKIGDSMRGRVTPNEAKAKRAQTWLNRTIEQNEEFSRKISEANLRRSPESFVSWNRGLVMTDAQKAGPLKSAQNRLGKPRDAETKQKIKTTKTGKISVTDGQKSQMILPSELDKYLGMGFVRGGTKWSKNKVLINAY